MKLCSACKVATYRNSPIHTGPHLDSATSSHRLLRGRFTAHRPTRHSTCRSTLAANAAAAAVDLSSSMHTLPDGAHLEVLRSRPAQESSRGPPLLFLHGAGHAAWCWQERFMPFLTKRGRDCYAISFRGQGNGVTREDSPPGTLASNAADAAHFIASLPRSPLVVSHSFGGLVLQKYLEKMEGSQWPQLAGMAFLASAPPTGNSELVKRTMRKNPIKSVKITWGFIRRSYQGNADMAKTLFFSEDIPAEDLERYTAQFKTFPGKGRLIDLKKLSDEVPIVFPPVQALPPVWVAGGDIDCIVDHVACHELAAELGEKAKIYENMAHDMMLDTRWQDVAEDLDEWVSSL